MEQKWQKIAQRLVQGLGVQPGELIDVEFHFTAGRIVDIEAASGADLLDRELDSHTGEPRRVSHMGLGLNPYLDRPTGWTMVDEHIHGSLFIALGENR